MANRLDLHETLCGVLGSRYVYFQPPESVKMHYPAIRYSLSSINAKHADDTVYDKKLAYNLILIDEDPDSEFVEGLLSLPYCSFDRAYASDNLNHFVFTLFY